MLRKRLLPLALCLVLAAASLPAAAARTLDGAFAQSLTVNRLAEPLGLDGPVVFGWKMAADAPGAAQTAYRIIVTKSGGSAGPVWDSGRIDSGTSAGILCGAALESMTAYEWFVRIWDNLGSVSDSEPARFETGLLEPSLWNCSEWISAAPAPKVFPVVSLGADINTQAADFEKLYAFEAVITNASKILPKPAAAGFRFLFKLIYDSALRNAGSSIFRKEFEVKSGLLSARLYITSLGVFDAYLNGERIGNPGKDGEPVYDELKPGYTQPGSRALYYTYDVAPLLAAGGTNALSAMVSNGWWRDDIVSNIGKQSALRAMLLLRYADGTTQTVASSTDWKAKTGGPVAAATIYDGEVYDARIPTGWKTSGYNDARWAAAVPNTEFAGSIDSATAGSGVGVREDLTLTPQTVRVLFGAAGITTKRYGNSIVVGEYSGNEEFTLKMGRAAIVDFGQNFAGVAQITAEGPRGTVVRIRHAEMLNEKDGIIARGNDGPGGNIYTKNLRGADAMAIYVLAGEGEETYRPVFTYFGFRYAEIIASEDIRISGIKGLVMTSVQEDTGSITTSDSALNKLVQNTLWGQYSNYVSVPTDCPQRDERLGWCADTQVFSAAACYNAESYNMLRKWMRDMRDCQRSDGAFPVIAPYGKYMWHAQLGWSDAGIVVPYNAYRMYGDSTIVAENYEAMRKFMDVYMASTGKEGGGLAYGDWLAFEANDDDLKRLIGIAYFAWDAQMMAEMAKALGKTGDEAKYRAVYQEEKEYFISRYINPDGTLKRTQQTACLMALKMDLFPDESSKQAAVQALVDNIERNGNKLQTGFLGTAFLLDVLTQIGRNDIAYKVLLQHECPSWLYCVDMGATTMWERWNSYTKEAGFGDPGMNSFNHYAYGVVAEWLYSRMAGIRCDLSAPGFKKIILEPVADPSLEFVDCRYESPYGTIKSGWRYENGLPVYEMTVPANTSATVYLPERAAAYTVSGGTATFIGNENGYAVYEIAAGQYEFVAV